MICVSSDLFEFLIETYSPVKMLSRESHVSYLDTAILFDRFCLKKFKQATRWWMITPESIGEFLTWYVDEQRRSKETAAKHRRQLRAMLRLAKRRGLVQIDLDEVPVVKCPKKLPKAWSVSEFERLLRAAQSLTGNVGPWPARNWWPALLLTCWSTDWRISAVMMIERGKTDLTTGAVLGFEPKTQEERCAELEPEAIEFLRRIWGSPRRYVFGDWPYDRGARQWQALNRHFGKLIEIAGVRDIGRFHAIRKTSTTAIAVDHGIDAAAEAAGHAHPSTTRKHYVDPTHLPRSGSRLPTLNIQLDAQLSLF